MIDNQTPKPKQIGPWIIRDTKEDFLGNGGNGTVSRAWRRDDPADADPIALKVINVSNFTSEPYIRFQGEVAALERAKDVPGVLPFISYHLKSAPVWLAMPLAEETMEDYRKSSPSLEDVVKAIASIADTLALLSEQPYEINHRDIKPANLFHYHGRWVVGDFGLASHPDQEAITDNGKKLGPLYYIAPEMLNDPENAKGGPADVYSLAKTLWVLATGQNYPVPGVQYINDAGLILNRYIAHPRLSPLNFLIQQATLTEPDKRPTMEQFANELHKWLNPSSGVTGMNTASPLAQDFQSLTDISIKDFQLRRERVEEFNKAVKQMLLYREQFATYTRDVSLPRGTGEYNTDSIPFQSYYCGDVINAVYGSTWPDFKAITEHGVRATYFVELPPYFTKDESVVQWVFEATWLKDGQVLIAASYIVRLWGETYPKSFWHDFMYVPFLLSSVNDAIEQVGNNMLANREQVMERVRDALRAGRLVQ